MQTPPRLPVPVHLDEVLNALARNARLPVPLLRRLLQHGGAREEAARWRSDLTEQVALEIDTLGNGKASHAPACNPDLPVGMKRRLARSDDAAVRSALAGRDAPLPRDLVEAFVADPSAQVRQAAAANRRSPSDLRARLATDPDPAVRAELAQWWTDAPEEVRRERAHEENRKWPGSPADNAVFPPETMRRFATDPDPRMRALALRDPELPAELVERLAQDDEARVRREAAAHPNLPAPAGLLLLGDADMRTAQAVAGSPHLPREAMEAILAVAEL
ncbi:hypothetical protein OG523_03445 [Streptomyces virginiae]|uniref:hypothetical protein n=1 Tax=Streptomyces virginiae TaxID=1961 RepID=UPI002E2EDD60|nr:hypothetical protein [Streptomyces virginiae]